jgi:ubiquinone/menaquinone biosynthesis C-methylase UbiE
VNLSSPEYPGRVSVSEEEEGKNIEGHEEEEERKKYMKDVYSSYWKDAREKIYGFSDYDRWLCQHVVDVVRPKSRILEVAIGTGFPLAEFLNGKGFDVYGADISPLLLRQCTRRIGGTVTVSDAENLCFASESFELTYCFHSTWYFPNLVDALREMCRVTRRGGIVTFDILNGRNEEIRQGHEINVRRSKGVRALPTRVRIISRRILGKPTNLRPVVHEVPTDPSLVYDYCQSEAKPFKVFAKNGKVLKSSDGGDEHQTESRLVFDVVA